MNRGAALLGALLVATSVIGMAAGASAATATTATTDGGASSSSTNAEAYTGAHVDFTVDGDAIANYSVGGEETFSSVSVQSQSEADAGAGLDTSVGIDLETMTGLDGTGLSLAAQTETSAQVESESGATLAAHDTQRGTLVVESGGESQYVEAELAADASAESEGDAVRVETDSHEGVFLVVGEGTVTVNGEGDVAAELEGDATLTFRSYEDGERDDDAEYEESLIADGTSAAEVHVEARDGETASSAVTYGEETSAEVSQTAESQVEMTVERAHGEGTVVITTVSEEAVGTLEDINVTVDGEAAVEASSKSELEAAAQGGDRSHYMVAQNAEAQGEATVYVAFNHFSERTATIDGDGDSGSSDGNDGTSDSAETTDGDDTSSDETSDDGADDSDDTTDGSDDSETSDSDSDHDDESESGGDSVPGFGASVAAIAISIAALLTRRER